MPALRVSPKMRAAMALWQSASAAPTSLARPMAWPCGSQTRRGPFRAEPTAGMGQHPAREKGALSILDFFVFCFRLAIPAAAAIPPLRPPRPPRRADLTETG
eukprot:scaffold10846_cov90-Isochrysis_galbana.AAC.3